MHGDAVVLGVPRGGVVVAVPVAAALSAPLDVVVPKKLGAPDNPELGSVPVAPGVRVVDERLVARLGVSERLPRGRGSTRAVEVARRTTSTTAAGHRCPSRDGSTVVVDDGVATAGRARRARSARAAGVASRTSSGAESHRPNTVVTLRAAC